ncbi:hypothetical protein ACFFGH_10675 [Lysobacter korlensis]|uniref:Uncharacterized protein n=1 Tax=Lysobacter korlensis TaxID=553636 RepID=A0ABV6RMU0_9GAMM
MAAAPRSGFGQWLAITGLVVGYGILALWVLLVVSVALRPE